MNIDIQIPGAKLFDALRSYAERAVHLAVAADRPVSRVAVRFSEYFGEERGASLTSCRIEAALRDENTVAVAGASASNPYRAVDEASARLMAVLEHHIGQPAIATGASSRSEHGPQEAGVQLSWLRSSASSERARARLVDVDERRGRSGFPYRRSSAGSRWVATSRSLSGVSRPRAAAD